MVMANTGLMTKGRSVLAPWVEWLNGPAHEKALWLYMVVVLAHWVEHLVQAYQIFVLHWTRPASLGALGLVFPWLVSTEILHFGYAVFMLVGLFILRPAFSGVSRVWWNISLGIQLWHFVEHFLLQGQALAGHNLFGSPVPISIVQLWVARPELHLIYNAAVFIPMVVAMFYHKYPPTKERMAYQTVCTCAR
jgi:hypothetical protein